ncbi:MAG: M48 family metallopeptidase [Campylobacterota bacterium]
MIFYLDLNNKEFKVELQQKRSMKNCYLRVIEDDFIQLKASKYFTKKDALELILKKQQWILKNSQRLENSKIKDDEFLFFGKVQKLDSYNLSKQKLDKFYKEQTSSYVEFLVQKHSDIMKLYPTFIKYRKNKNTWGSCNYKNGLNFNIYLSKFPLEVIEYVVIHELAHIKHKNHSKEFWDLVYKFCKDYKQRERLLKSLL